MTRRRKDLTYKTGIGDICPECYFVPWDVVKSTFDPEQVKHCGKCNCCNGRIPLQ